MAAVDADKAATERSGGHTSFSEEVEGEAAGDVVSGGVSVLTGTGAGEEAAGQGVEGAFFGSKRELGSGL